MKIGLFLDYMRLPKVTPPYINSWQVVRSDKEFVEFITNYYRENRKMPEIISLSHDLTPQQIEFCLINPPGTPIMYDHFEEKTGLSSASWLVQVCSKNNIPMDFKVCVHSETDNPIGTKNIQMVINANKENQDCFLMDWKEYDYVPERKEIYDRIKERKYNEFEEEMRLESIAKRLEKEIYGNNN